MFKSNKGKKKNLSSAAREARETLTQETLAAIAADVAAEHQQTEAAHAREVEELGTKVRELERELARKDAELERLRAREERKQAREKAIEEASKPAPSGVEHRHHPRFLVNWRVAVVNEDGENQHIFYGRAHDISLGGLGFLCDHNIYFSESVIVLISVPPRRPNDKVKIVEARARTVYSVLAASQGQFRVGMHFVEFKGTGRKVLEEHFAGHYSYF